MVKHFCALPLLLFILLALMPGSLVFALQAPAFVGQVKLVRSPAVVYSDQPVLVFAYVPGGGSVGLEVSVSVKAVVNASELTPPPPFLKTYRIKMIPVPWASGWYIAHIPGLPAKSWSFKKSFFLKTITVGFSVGSEVTYKLVVDDVVVASGGYVVKESEVAQNLPPFTYAFVYDVLKDPSLINETLGLGPHGWVLAGGESMKVMVIAFDEKAQPDLSFEYRVGGGSWVTASLSDSPLMSQLYSLVNDVNSDIQNLENWVRQYAKDITIPRARLTIRVDEAVIPAQDAGTYVTFRSTARDIDGNTMVSPEGFYFIDNGGSGTRILIIDPHVELWLLKENVEQLLNTLKSNINYGAPADVSAPIKHVRKISKALVDYGIEPFHHWEYLGGKYRIYITWPNEEVANLLNTYKPNVIILSNLGLGLQNKSLWDWDLKDIVVGGSSLLDNLVSYVRQTHAGLIATHATLSDEVVWLSCEDKVKVGARGHVGSSVDDVNVFNEQTVAALLGMPELSLWEYARDKVAEALCSNPELEPAATLTGSVPLQVPYVPWNGVLKLTPEAKELGWSLPEEFTVEIPTVAQSYGLKAYTEVGWQLALPRALAYAAWGAASGEGTNFAKLRNKVSLLYENITNGFVKAPELSDFMGKSVGGSLKNFYRALNTARIKGTTLSISVPIPGTGKILNKDINIGEGALTNLLQKMPVKIIALSPNGLAGIIVHDKFWDPNGYRTVYFSFEVEAGEGEIIKELLTSAVEWVKTWQYKTTTELLGNLLRAPKEVVSDFNNALSKIPGNKILSDGLILNEEGSSEIELNTEPGTLYLLVAHPTTQSVNVNIVRGSAKVVSVTKVDPYVTQVVIEISGSGTIVVSLSAGSNESLNPAYVTVKYNAYTPKPTQITSYPTQTTTTTSIPPIISMPSTTTSSTTETHTTPTTSLTSTTTSLTSLIPTSTTASTSSTTSEVITETTAPSVTTSSRTLSHAAGITTNYYLIGAIIALIVVIGVIVIYSMRK